MRIAVIALAAFALTVGLAAQQRPAGDPQAVFRGGVSYVEVDAYVTNAAGESVADLTANDFELIDGGSPQPITTFAAVKLPTSRVESAPAPIQSIRRDVWTNTNLVGRLYLVVVDDLHIDNIRTPAVRTALRDFIEQDLGPGDLAAIVSTSGRTNASADFTTNRSALLAVIERVMGQKLPSATLRRVETARDSQFQDDFKGSGQDPAKRDRHTLAVGADPDADERVFRARKTIATLRQLSEFMAAVSGRRKAMVLVSEGVEYDLSRATDDNARKGVPVLIETQEALRAATRSNVAVYAIDPRGLADAASDLIQSPAFGAVGVASMQDELRVSHDSLRVIADNTGGFAALDQNDLSSAFERIVQQNSTYYLLGFSPVKSDGDGRYHRLEVKVKRPGLKVKARPGYFATRRGDPARRGGSAGSAKAAIDQALASPLPIQDLPLKVFAAAFKGAGAASIEFGMEIDASQLDFAEKNGTFNSALDVVVAVTDATGRAVPSVRQTINLALTPAVLERVRTHGLRVIEQAALQPGTYPMRVVVADANGKAGSVIDSLDVPDFAAVPLALSGLTLTTSSAAEIPTAGTKDPRLPTPPTAVREFASGDEVVVAGEIYETGRGPSHTVTILTQLRRGERVIRSGSEQYTSDEGREAAEPHAFANAVPLSKLEPGTYVLRIDARTGDGASAIRDVEIHVR